VEHGGHGGSAAGPVAREMIKAYLGKDHENEDSQGSVMEMGDLGL
jgi:hypothetical protein